MELGRSKEISGTGTAIGLVSSPSDSGSPSPVTKHPQSCDRQRSSFRRASSPVANTLLSKRPSPPDRKHHNTTSALGTRTLHARHDATNRLCLAAAGAPGRERVQLDSSPTVPHSVVGDVRPRPEPGKEAVCTQPGRSPRSLNTRATTDATERHQTPPDAILKARPSAAALAKHYGPAPPPLATNAQLLPALPATRTPSEFEHPKSNIATLQLSTSGMLTA